jgi:hypothetical protein
MKTTRIAATLTAALAALALAAPVAVADSGQAPAPVDRGDLAAARTAAQSPAVLAQLGHFFARKGVPPTAPLAVPGAAEAQAAAQAAPALVGDTVPVYTLDPAFVAGTAGAPVARVDFTATKAVSADGQSASVWTVRSGDHWQVVNIASGSDETDYAARGAAGGGGTVFREPQLNAWYVLRGGRVLPLDGEARASVGGGVSLAAYQKLVRQRYGDKLPGSGYDRAGLGGGFSAAGAARSGGGDVAGLVAAGALGATALAGAALAVRRRRTAAA